MQCNRILTKNIKQQINKIKIKIKTNFKEITPTRLYVQFFILIIKYNQCGYKLSLQQIDFINYNYKHLMSVSEQSNKTLKYLQSKSIINPKLSIGSPSTSGKSLHLLPSKNAQSKFCNIYYGIQTNKAPNDQKGIIIFENGDYYIGSFVQGCMKGKGKLNKISLETGDQIFYYEGEWNNNLPNGKGLQKIGDNIKYKGDFVNGKKQGTGILDFGNGTKYFGQFKNNQIYGQGKYTTLQNQWEGIWKDGYLQGKGQQTIFGSNKVNNSFYEGNFKGGYKQGKGRFIWGTDKQYQGEFSKGQLNGLGKLKVGNKQFVGKWQNGLDKSIKQGFKSSNIHMKSNNSNTNSNNNENANK